MLISDLTWLCEPVRCTRPAVGAYAIVNRFGPATGGLGVQWEQSQGYGRKDSLTLERTGARESKLQLCDQFRDRVRRRYGRANRTRL
jgi:hypothetical protein